MIEALSLTKRYGNLTAIDQVSFQIGPGEVVGLLGPNGAGKTTTMRILTGFMPPTSGNISIAGYDLLEKPREAKMNLGYLPETPPLYPELTVKEMLDFVAGLRGLVGNVKKEKMEKAMEKTGVTSVRGRLIGHLSKGYRQRVGIAQAILHEPPFLILDEPTIGLDPKQILEIRELLSHLKGERSILLSSHILQEITAVCDRIMIIHKGKLVANSKMADVTDLLGGQKKRLTVTLSKNAGEARRKIEQIPGVESVMDYASDLEDVFLQLTKEN